MPTANLAKQAHAVRTGLAQLERNLEDLLGSVGGSIGSALSDRVAEPLKALSGHVNPLLALLGSAAVVGTVVAARRGPGRPRKDAAAPAPTAAPKARKRRRGGRGRKANLTAEAIQAALKASGGNKSAAARALGVSQPTFYKYLGAAKIGVATERATKPAAAPVKRGPGRPPKAVAATPAAAAKSNKQRTGGRGQKANLTAEAIQAALKQTGGVKSRAADVLGVSQPTLYNYLKALGLAARNAVGRGAKKSKQAK